MKYLTKTQTSSFEISQLLANALDSRSKFTSTVQNRTKVFILNDSHIRLFRAALTTSLTHFYAKLFGKKYRVTLSFFTFLKTGFKRNNTSPIMKKVSESKYFIEVCAGAGGLSTGFIRSKFKPLLLNDNNKQCVETLKLNHPEVLTVFVKGIINKHLKLYLMKYLIKIQTSSFEISHLLANALDSKNKFTSTVQNKTKVFILNDSHISLFQVVSTTSPTHFYVGLFGKKYRVCKSLFNHINNLKHGNLICLNNPPLKPLFKWSGGKRGEIKVILDHLPAFDRYIEPFVGGGSLFFHLNYANSVINDAHFELYCFYKALKVGGAGSIYNFMLMHPNTEECYYWVRDKMTISCDLDVAKRFFYLRKTCFRGMLRYNKSGKFNIPFGHYKKINYSCLLDDSFFRLFQNTDIYNFSFDEIFKLYNSPNNFLFIDPPYDSAFNNYNGDTFDKVQHELLFDCFQSTKNKCLLILGKTDFTEDLYRNYIHLEYPVKYRFKLYSGRVANNLSTTHLLIKNY
jgi:DNA adenine methylase